MSKTKGNKKDLSRSIIIIENDRDFAESLAENLEIEDYLVTLAFSADEAIDKVKSIKPCIGLIDIHLGLENGINLISDLKKVYPKILCIIMTAYAGIDSAVQAIKRGAYDYLRKPLSIPELLATMKRCFEKLRLEKQKEDAEEALKKSEELYRKFFEEDITGDFIATSKGKLILCNPPLARMFGFDSVEMALEHGLNMLFSNKQEWQKFLKKINTEKKLTMYEIKLQKCNGTPANIIANVIGRFNENDKLIEMNGYLMDITEYKHLENMYLHSQKMEAIGRLAGGVAHDFNNILSLIYNYSSYIKKSVDKNSQTYEDIEEIIKATKRASSLTERLLTFSKRQNIRVKVININAIILDMQKMLERLIGDNIELITIVDSSSAFIKADSGQITQVIMNLAINGRDAMPNGGKLIIKTSNIKIKDTDKQKNPEIEPGEYIKLVVSDTGIGMDEKTKSHIFEPFFSTKEQGKGTGLGLATVFGIVKQSKGYISVESQLNQGVIFEILFPITTEKKKLKKVMQERHIPHNLLANILIVEDEKGINKLIARILKQVGYNPIAANNGIEALEICKTYKNPIHLVITDLMMPKMGGEELVEKLKLNYPNVKVLYISGYATNSFLQQSNKLKAGTDFIPKPFTEEEIIKKVKNLIVKNNKM